VRASARRMTSRVLESNTTACGLLIALHKGRTPCVGRDSRHRHSSAAANRSSASVARAIIAVNVPTLLTRYEVAKTSPVQHNLLWERPGTRSTLRPGLFRPRPANEIPETVLAHPVFNVIPPGGAEAHLVRTALVIHILVLNRIILPAADWADVVRTWRLLVEGQMATAWAGVAERGSRYIKY